MTDLKPCPFCGGEATAIDESKQAWCNDCFAAGPLTEEHVDAWNRRAETATESSDKWVSVEERLPELEKSVLLCVRHGDPKQAHFSEAISGYRMTDPEHYTPEEWDNEEGASFPPEYSTDEWGTVTHWMPLPEPPEAP